MISPQILSIGFTCRHADAIANFFESHLGCQRLEEISIDGGAYSGLIGLNGSQLKLIRLGLGSERLELMQVEKLGPGLRSGRSIPLDSQSNDLWFQHICIVVNDMTAVSAPICSLIAAGQLQPISSAPQTLPSWNTAAADIQAFKFHDPERHCLELLQFPADKGDARWHSSATNSPVLGIDHSAIANANTTLSCRFYEELLGLQLGGDGMNSGLEQDHLDGLSDTQVHITSHRCVQGAGIECLNYLQPSGGRPLPPDQSAADLAHWQVRLAVNDLGAIASRLESYCGSFVNPQVVDLTAGEAGALGFSKALQIRDPDGHQLQLVSG
jgi:catechol 2,3-dioxygenase-like lactoylglutathione lyase family enzyme